ncbi:hypothetical protein ES703_14918 [subsurface metagenome]
MIRIPIIEDIIPNEAIKRGSSTSSLPINVKLMPMTIHAIIDST